LRRRVSQVTNKENIVMIKHFLALYMSDPLVFIERLRENLFQLLFLSILSQFAVDKTESFTINFEPNNNCTVSTFKLN